MGNLTSTLTVHLNDDVSGPAGKAAGALHKLGASGNDLKKLAGASPEAAKLVKELERLQAAAKKIEAFREASRGLGAAGNDFRTARAEVSRLSNDLVKAKAKLDAFKGVKGGQAERDGAAAEVRKIERALRTANATLVETKGSWRSQGVAVRAMRNELLSAGVELGAYNRKAGEVVGRGLNFTKAQTDIAAATARANKALAHQSTLLETGARRAATASVAHRDVASAMGASDAGRQARERASRRLADGMGAPARAARERAEIEARHREKRATASDDLASGMGAAGRAPLADIEARDRRANANADASRRMTDGMGAPSRQAARERADAESERERVRSARNADRRDAAGTIAAGTSLYLGHKGKEVGIAAINAAAEMDYAVRYQHIATDVTEDDQKNILIPQAKRIGQETKFSNKDVVEAQTATMQSLPFTDPTQKAEVGSAIVDQARNYAVIMKADMTRASEGIRSFLQSTNKDLSTKEKAVSEATRGTNLIVKMSKLGGMNDDDAQQFVKYGFPSGTQAGLSDTTIGALGSVARRSGLRGDESGVFVRSASSKLVAPTSKGLDALTAAGIDFNSFTKMPGGLNVDNLESFGKRRFGKGFNTDQRGRLKDLLEDGEVVGNREDFTKQVSDIVAESFDKKKDGTTKAQDAQKIAKMVGDFHKLSTESVDTEGLLNAILTNPKMTAALRNAFFTDKHGGKAGILASHMDQFASDKSELERVSADPEFASRKAKYNTEGVGGAVDNFKGSLETLVLNIGTANKDLIKGVADGISSVADGVANLPEKTVQAGTALTAVAASGASAASALAIMGKLTGSTSLGAAAGGIGALALPVLGAGVAAGVLYAASDESKGLVHGGKPDITMNPGDELPGLDGSTDKPSWAPPPAIAPNRPSLAEGVPSLIDASRKDTGGSIKRARQDLAAYSKELAAVQSEMAGQSGLDLPGLGSGLEDRKAELERMVRGAQERLKALGAEAAPKADAAPVAPKADAAPVAPKADAAPAAAKADAAPVAPKADAAPVAPKGDACARDGLVERADAIKGKVDEVSASTAAPKADPSALDGIGQKADEAKGKLAEISATSVTPSVDTSALDALIAKADQAAAALQRLAGLAASANASISSVGSAGGGGGNSGRVRQAVGNNH